jgi:molybdopterin-guanine dinucleotide biosynthesis protein A
LLAGRPLILYPLEALAPVCARLAVVCKAGTLLPELPPDVERWDEPDEPRHPLTGILHALETAGAPVLVCAADMPFVTAAACGELLTASGGGRGCAVAGGPGGLEPLLGAYRLGAETPLRAAANAGASARESVASLDPVVVAFPAELTWSVNTPEDLDAAAARLSGSRPGAG